MELAQHDFVVTRKHPYLIIINVGSNYRKGPKNAEQIWSIYKERKSYFI